jgi:hypothetical protein
MRKRTLRVKMWLSGERCDYCAVILPILRIHDIPCADDNKHVIVGKPIMVSDRRFV